MIIGSGNIMNGSDDVSSGWVAQVSILINVSINQSHSISKEGDEEGQGEGQIKATVRLR